MKMEIAKSIADLLANRPEVAETEVAMGDMGDPYVKCVVTNRFQERAVKRDLDQYPVYVQLDVDPEYSIEA